MLITESIIFLERLRLARGFTSQEKFVDDICDVRQYRKYIKGDAPMPSEIFLLLISRLNMNIDEVLKFYMETSNAEKKIVQRLYNSLMSNQIDDLGIKISNLEKTPFVETTDQMLFNFCKYLYEYKIGRITNIQYKSKVKVLIGFDQLIKYDILSLYEMLVLSNLMDELNKDESKLITDKLTTVLKHYHIDDINSLDYYLIILYTLVRVHGNNENYQQAIELCDLSIEKSKQKHHYYLIAQLYYLKAYYYNKLGNILNRNECIHLCIGTLEIGPKTKINSLIRGLLEKNLKIDIFDFEYNYWLNKKSDITD